MSASSRLELRVGLLIVAGLAALVILILVSDRFSFDRTYPVTAYLDNASGLSAGTPVTLAGIRIGKIDSIRSINDKRGAVQVVLSINARYLLPIDGRLHVASSGIFGDSFLEFAGSGVRTTATLPTDGSAEVIASPGFFEKASDQAMHIMEAVNDLLTPQTRGDAKRLLANAADLAGESAGLVKDLRAQTDDLHGALVGVGEVARDIHETTRSLGVRIEQSLGVFDGVVAGLGERADAVGARFGDVAGVAIETLHSFDVASDEAAGVLHDNRAELHGALDAIADVSRRTAEVMDGLHAGRGVIGQLLVNQDLTKDLNDVAINLSVASQLIADHPETLVFGATNKQQLELQARRDRLRIRRAFQEGYYKTPPVQVVEPIRIAEPPPTTR